MPAVLAAAAITGYFDARAATIIILLYFILPFTNGLVDWGSWWVSRFLFEKMRGDTKLSALLLHMLVDAIFAVGFLVLIVLLLTFWIVQLNKLMVHLGLQTVPWLTYAEAAAQSPFGQGFFVTSMLLSTLLPTLLHLFCAIASIIFVPLRKLSNIGGTLAGKIVLGKGITANEKVVVFGMSWICCFAASSLFIGMWSASSRLMAYADIPIGQGLIDVAELATKRF